MKNILVAATVVGAAAAGVILYMSRHRNSGRYMLEGAADTAEGTGRRASRYLRRAKRKMNDVVNDLG